MHMYSNGSGTVNIYWVWFSGPCWKAAVALGLSITNKRTHYIHTYIHAYKLSIRDEPRRDWIVCIAKIRRRTVSKYRYTLKCTLCNRMADAKLSIVAASWMTKIQGSICVHIIGIVIQYSMLLQVDSKYLLTIQCNFVPERLWL